MAILQTKYFGNFETVNDWCFHFPLGLPAFEDEQQFVPIDVPSLKPLIFLQSVRTPGLCFLAFPALAVDQEYQLHVAPEDLEILGYEHQYKPVVGTDVLVLAILSVRDGFPVTANLLAPLVINIRSGRAVQAVRPDRAYSHEHPVPQAEARC